MYKIHAYSWTCTLLGILRRTRVSCCCSKLVWRQAISNFVTVTSSFSSRQLRFASCNTILKAIEAAKFRILILEDTLLSLETPLAPGYFVIYISVSSFRKQWRMPPNLWKLELWPSKKCHLRSKLLWRQDISRFTSTSLGFCAALFGFFFCNAHFPFRVFLSNHFIADFFISNSISNLHSSDRYVSNLFTWNHLFPNLFVRTNFIIFSW